MEDGEQRRPRSEAEMAAEASFCGSSFKVSGESWEDLKQGRDLI